MTHITNDQLNDLVDGRLGSRRARETEEHLGGCEHCRRRLAALKSLRDMAASVAQAVEPSQDLWPEIRARIEDRKIIPLRMHGRPTSRSMRTRVVRLAAAVIGVALLSSLATIVVMSRLETGQRTTATRTEIAPVVEVIAGYEATANELLLTVAARKSTLPPEVIDQLERNLRIIDAALDETMAMLTEDEDNETARALLVSGYRQKLAIIELVVNES